jgi:hypothetical protein
MGRKQVFPRGDAINPLQRMLGTYLRLERTRLGYSSKEVADKLGLSDTYFRLAESGRVALNQSMVFDVIEVFGDSHSQTRDNVTLSFNRFALFMVGMHWVGAEMAAQAKKRRRDSARLAVEDLASRVADFHHFHQKTKRYFDLPEDEQRSFLEKFAAPEVGEFLRLDPYVPDPNAADPVSDRVFSVRELLGLPTLNIDILLDLKQSLTGRSFVHTADVASRWEAQRASQFKFERGLYARTNLIVSEKNLNTFHFKHLREEGFLEVQMMFLDAKPDDEPKLMDDFVKFLNKGRLAGGSKPLTTEEIKKVKFICLSDALQDQHKSALDELRSRDSALHEAYWAFETHTGLDIAFVGVLGENADNTRNLNLEHSIRRAKLFSQVWDAANKG